MESWVVTQTILVWRAVRSSKFVHDTGKLLVFQFAGRAIAFFAAAHAMRCLGPEQLGVGAFVLSILAQGAVLGDLGLNIAGVRAIKNYPEKLAEIISIVWGIRLRAAVVLSIFFLAGVWILRPVGNMALWIIAAPLLILSVLSPQWIFQGMERIPVFSAIQLAQTGVSALLYFCLFKPGAQAELYVAVAVVTNIVGWFSAFFVLRRHVQISWLSFDWHQAWKMLHSSGYAFAIVLAIFVYTGLEIPLITLLMTPADAGVYRAAQGIVGILTPVISIGPLLIYPRLIAWENRSQQEFVQKALITILVLTGLATLICLSAIVWVPLAFTHLLGPDFMAGITPCLILVFAKGLVLVANVSVWGLLAHNLDKRYLWVTLSAAFVSISLNLILIPRFGIIAASITNMVSEFLILSLSCIALSAFLRNAQRKGPSVIL